MPSRRTMLPLCFAVFVHAVALAIVLFLTMGEEPTRPTLRTAPAPSLDAVEITVLDESELPLGPSVKYLLGAGDVMKPFEGHPNPNAGFDAPGQRAAARGAGMGRPSMLTRRRDRGDLRSEVWNDPRRYQIPRRGHAPQAASSEAMRREQRRDYDDRTAASQAARQRQTTEHAKKLAGREGEIPSRSWEDLDPRFSLPGSPARPRPGAVRSDRARLLADVGPATTDTSRRGPTRDSESVAAASDALRSDAFDIGSDSAGGEHEKAPGGRGRGSANTSGLGRAALAANAARGRGGPIRARRHNPFFRNLYRQLDKRIRYPRELALALEQGFVVVRFRLHADGTLSAIRLTRSSGFGAFDEQVLNVLKAIGGLGRVPGSIMKGRASHEVDVEYTFRNPMVR